MNSAHTPTAAYGASRRCEPTVVIVDERGGSGRPRVLVVYESRYGSTAEVADRIGNALCEAGSHVDAPHVGDVDTVDNHDLVILGGAIQYYKWMPGAADFVRTHRQRLAITPTALFFT